MTAALLDFRIIGPAKIFRTCVKIGLCAVSLTLASSASAENSPKPAARRASLPVHKPVFLGLRLPAFVAFGVGSLGAGGAVVTGILANAESTASVPNCNKGCDNRDATPSETLQVASTILAGVAAAGVVVGVGLMFTAPQRTEHSTLTPSLRLGVTPEKASASAVWRF